MIRIEETANESGVQGLASISLRISDTVTVIPVPERSTYILTRSPQNY